MICHKIGLRGEADLRSLGFLQGDIVCSHVPVSHSSCFYSSLAQLPSLAFSLLSGFIVLVKAN